MEVTGTLEVLRPDGTTRMFSWNGDAADRDAARRAFDEATAEGATLAVVYDSPGRAHAVRSFTEVEEVERERGTVTVQVSHAIVGG